MVLGYRAIATTVFPQLPYLGIQICDKTLYKVLVTHSNQLVTKENCISNQTTNPQLSDDAYFLYVCGTYILENRHYFRLHYKILLEKKMVVCCISIWGMGQRKPIYLRISVARYVFYCFMKFNGLYCVCCTNFKHISLLSKQIQAFIYKKWSIPVN